MSFEERLPIPKSCTRIAICASPFMDPLLTRIFLEQTSSIALRFCLFDLSRPLPDVGETIGLLRAAQVKCLRSPQERIGLTDETKGPDGDWLYRLPDRIELYWRQQEILLCHGSAASTGRNSSLAPEYIGEILESNWVDGICGTQIGAPYLCDIPNRGFWLDVGSLQARSYGVIEFTALADRPSPFLRELSG